MDRRELFSALLFTCGPDAVRASLVEDGVIGDDGPIPGDAPDATMLSIYADFLTDESDEDQARALDACESFRGRS